MRERSSDVTTYYRRDMSSTFVLGLLIHIGSKLEK